jgi:hypothetical protein
MKSPNFMNMKAQQNPGIMVHDYNPSTWEAEADG